MIVPFRIGQGFDVHALVPGRPLIIGGVTIPFERGLLGHSDADVLLHAITDAVLGAAGLGDIGTHFPDTDAAFRGADSARLLAEATRRVRAEGWQIGNVDSTVIAQAPRLGIETLTATIFASNTGSLRLFARMGFERWGFMPRVARLEGVEKDLVLVGRRLCEPDALPAAARAA